jgi:hypothetical protein
MNAPTKKESTTPPADLQECIKKLKHLNFHISNLVGLLKDKADAEMYTVALSAIRYINDEYHILEHLDGNDDEADEFAAAMKGGV